MQGRWLLTGALFTKARQGQSNENKWGKKTKKSVSLKRVLIMNKCEHRNPVDRDTIINVLCKTILCKVLDKTAFF